MEKTRAERNTTSTEAKSSACCGGPAPRNVDACCARDAHSKAAGESGCGCGSAEAQPKPSRGGCCGTSTPVLPTQP